MGICKPHHLQPQGEEAEAHPGHLGGGMREARGLDMREAWGGDMRRKGVCERCVNIKHYVHNIFVRVRENMCARVRENVCACA